MTKEKWKQMSEEEHAEYWERYYNRMEAIGITIGTVVGIIIGNLLIK